MNCGIIRDEFLKFSLECSSSNNKLDFYNRVYPKLQNLVPHEMFGGFTVTLHDNYPFFHLDVGRFGSKKTYPQASGNVLPCLLFDRWKKMKPLVIVDSDEIPNVGHQNVQSITCHGQVDISRTSCCYFVFLGINTGNSAKYYEDLAELVVPQLHSLFSRIGNSVPKRHLSDREIEVLRWIAKGHSNNQIASVLNISAWTIQTHIKNIMHKLKVGKRSHAVAKAQSYGLTAMV